MEATANIYINYHSLQRYDGMKFLKQCGDVLNWTDLSQETVMDIGCGPGTSCRMLFDVFPKISKLIAIDVSPKMIALARNNFRNQNIDYNVVDILDKQKLKIWEGKISKVVSLNCLHWIPDQERVLRNIFDLLKAGGEAGLLLVTQSCHYKAAKAMFHSQKWKGYSEGMGSIYPLRESQILTPVYYNEILKKVGFEVIICKEENESFRFQTEKDCIGFICSLCPLADKVPFHLKDEVEKDYFTYFKKHTEAYESEQPVVHYKYLKVIVKKADL